MSKLEVDSDLVKAYKALAEINYRCIDLLTPAELAHHLNILMRLRDQGSLSDEFEIARWARQPWGFYPISRRDDE